MPMQKGFHVISNKVTTVSVAAGVQEGGLPGGVAGGVEGAGGGEQRVALPTAALLTVGALLSRGGAGDPRGGHGLGEGASWGWARG